MGKIAQWFGFESDAPSAQEVALENEVEVLRGRLEEGFAQLELARDNAGYLQLMAQYSEDFSRDGLRSAADQGRLFGVANPLIKRGREARHAYVWGQGVSIDAKNSDVNDVIQAYLDDEGNKAAFFGSQARQQYEGCLYDEGNFFLAHFTDPLTGRVQVRTLPFDEISDVITAPGDRTVPWYYKRRWVETETFDGVTQSVPKVAYYPALKYQPQTRQRFIGGDPVFWDSPVLHVKVNAGHNWKFGIGDSYAAIPWALSHKGYLEDWALLMKALAKIAYVTTSKSGSQAQAKRQSLKGLGETPAGSTVNLSEDQKLEPLSKSGATLDSESSRPLATMAASALGLPVTVLLADPGQTGARAVAETLDFPTRLTMQARQQLHTSVYQDSIGYMLEQAVIAPRGPLRKLGRPLRDGDRLKVEYTDPDETSINVTWPSLEQVDIKVLMDAVVAADGMPDVPKLPLVRMALQILKVENIDELIDEITDADGNLIPQEPEVDPGNVATKALRKGQDPADALK